MLIILLPKQRDLAKPSGSELVQTPLTKRRTPAMINGSTELQPNNRFDRFNLSATNLIKHLLQIAPGFTASKSRETWLSHIGAKDIVLSYKATKKRYRYTRPSYTWIQRYGAYLPCSETKRTDAFRIEGTDYIG
jgi:hypothetical protein